MNKIVLIVLIVFSLAASVGAVFAVNNTLKNKNEKILTELNTEEIAKKEEINRIKSHQDQNKYIPSDVIKNFINEVKSENLEKAKLYLTKENQTKDITAWISLEKPAISLSTIDSSYIIDNFEASVKMNYSFDTDESFYRVFDLTQEDGVWKIKEIKKGE